MSFALLLYLRVRCELILLPYRIRFYEKQNKVLSAKEGSRKNTRLYAGTKIKKIKNIPNSRLPDRRVLQKFSKS